MRCTHTWSPPPIFLFCTGDAFRTLRPSCDSASAVPNSHGLVEKNRGVGLETPEKQQVSMMIDDELPAQTYLFLPKGHEH